MRAEPPSKNKIGFGDSFNYRRFIAIAAALASTYFWFYKILF